MAVTTSKSKENHVLSFRFFVSFEKHEVKERWNTNMILYEEHSTALNIPVHVVVVIIVVVVLQFLVIHWGKTSSGITENC